MSESKCGGCDPELRVDLAAYDRVTPGRANQITLARVNTPTRNILRKFDNNGDGRIDANEIQAIVTTLVAEKFKSKAFKIGLIILAVFTAVLLGAMFGLTWAVVAALKDTQVQGGILVTNDREQAPVLVANMDLTVAGSKLVSRNSSSILSTSTVQTAGAITVTTSFQKLVALQNLVFVTPSNATYSLAILGIARIPAADAEDGYIVRVQTASGTLTLQNKTWSVTNLTGPLLEDAFAVQTRRRRSLVEDEDADEGKLYFYFICEDGECGDALPCGLPGLDPCPVSPPAVVDPGEDGGSQYDEVDSGDENTGTSTCVPTMAVKRCSDGLRSCKSGVPTSAERTKYMGQPGCTSKCTNGWYLNVFGECEGATAMRFCCT